MFIITMSRLYGQLNQIKHTIHQLVPNGQDVSTYVKNGFVIEQAVPATIEQIDAILNGKCLNLTEEHKILFISEIMNKSKIDKFKKDYPKT